MHLLFRSVDPHAFEVARHFVNETVMCSKKVNGGGAVGLSALLHKGNLDRASLKGKNVVVRLCWSNIDTTNSRPGLQPGFAADDRLCRFVNIVSDLLGGITRLKNLLHQHRASIKDVLYNQAWVHSSVDQLQVKVVVEL